MAAVDRDCWTDILNIPAWTPLSATGISTERLSENLRKVCDQTYLLVVDTDQQGHSVDGPYVTSAVWAETDGAALRAVDGDLEADTQIENKIIPVSVLVPSGATPTYSSILAALRDLDGGVIEAGEYRIATDGAFLHKVIRGRRRTYYFRERRISRSERPFAIACRLS